MAESRVGGLNWLNSSSVTTPRAIIDARLPLVHDSKKTKVSIVNRTVRVLNSGRTLLEHTDTITIQRRVMERPK